MLVVFLLLKRPLLSQEKQIDPQPTPKGWWLVKPTELLNLGEATYGQRRWASSRHAGYATSEWMGETGAQW